MKTTFISQIVEWFNFWLVLIIILTVVVGELTKVDTPKALSLMTSSSADPEKKAGKKTRPFSGSSDDFPLGKIYQRENIFGIAPLSEDEPASTITSLSLPKMKELSLPDPRPTPKISKRSNIIDPLNITVNGVITCDDFYKNLCMISDSSGKEQMYRVGDLVETSTIVSINSSGVSLIRPNGQIETFCLGIPTDFGNKDGTYSRVVDKNNVELDYKKLEVKVSSVGELIQELGIQPSYNGEALEGFVVTSTGQMAKDFGLVENDMITAVDKQPVASSDNRIEIYKKITAMDYDSSFAVSVKRGDESLEICYKLKTIDNSVESDGISATKDVADKKTESKDANVSDAGATKTSGENSAQEPKKEFSELISPEESFNQYYKNIEEIKKRLSDRINGSRLVINGAT